MKAVSRDARLQGRRGRFGSRKLAAQSSTLRTCRAIDTTHERARASADQVGFVSDPRPCTHRADARRPARPARLDRGYCGHKTQSIFDRYNIVNEAGLRAGVANFAEHLNPSTKSAKRTKGTIMPWAGRREAEMRSARPIATQQDARTGTRTRTPLRERDFKSLASTRFAIPANP